MPSEQSNSPPPDSQSSPTKPRGPFSLTRWLLKLLGGVVGLVVTAIVGVVVAGLLALAVAYPNLPDLSSLQDYSPKLPLRVYTQDGKLMGEFGEERRSLVPIQQIPAVMKNAVLAVEDPRFYSHGGIDMRGVFRAAWTDLTRLRLSEGAGTITMQVARNVYLSAEKTYTRKIYEVLLTFKLEHQLSKDQILEIYMNQIFLGNRAYGFESAAETYFGKPLKDIDLAEAAMLAGLPKAPSAYNPISNPKRARARQIYILDRMVDAGYITQAQADAAKAEELHISSGTDEARVHGEYVAEMVRQLIFAQYGDESYTRGLNVYTTLSSTDQAAAYAALRRGLMDFEKRQVYRGPELFIDLPSDPAEQEDAIDEALVEHPDNGDIYTAVVLEASPKKVVAVRQDGEHFEIVGEGLRPAQSGLADKAAPKIKIRRGAVIRVIQNAKGAWEITQLPEVQGAFVAITPQSGAIRALVGGFDYELNKFNHVTQAWRQPGSSFKPFIYSAALEKGFTPETVINDAPMHFDAGVGGQPWDPKDYDGHFDGPMSMRRGLALSKNLISIRILQAIGTSYAQDWITRFGFDADRHPAYLTMALGAGSVTPLQMATAYSVFANGGYRVNPYLITKITDQRGRTLLETAPPALSDANRVITPRNAFIMDTLLNTVTSSGTAARAQAVLKRNDVYGKTGTTNDSIDAWFAGFQPTMAAISWIGYDNPRKLGDKETGGGLSLPVWISYMQTALQGVPVQELTVPEGVVHNGDWAYTEYAHGAGVRSVGMDSAVPPSGDASAATGSDAASPATPSIAPPEEKNKILDLFKN